MADSNGSRITRSITLNPLIPMHPDTKTPTAKHTPGPWAVQADPEWKGKHPLHDSRFVTYGGIAMDDEDWDHHPNCGVVCRMTDTVCQAANARLIAAAPELLEALKQATDQLKVDYVHTPLDGHGALIRKLEAAIHNATLEK